MNTMEINTTLEMERADALAQTMIYDLGVDEDEDAAEFVRDFVTLWAADDHAHMAKFYRQAQPNATKLLGQIVRYLQDAAPRTAMTVYRGTSGRESLPGLQSWTMNCEIAEFYATRNGGQVIERNVTADEILCDWQVGMGLACAEEIIIINE
jgi:hypothetical protein